MTLRLSYRKLLGLKRARQSSRHGAVETNPTGNHEAAGAIPGLVQWVEDLVLP